MKLRRPSPSRRGGACRALWLGCLLMAGACNDPQYVSLGWNDSAVRAGKTSDAGGLNAGSSGEATSIDFTAANARDRVPPCTFGRGRVELPAACDPRPLAACPQLGETPALTLDALLSSVLRECGQIDDVLSVRFAASCAVAFELASDAAALASVPPARDPADAAAPDAALDTAALDSAAPERAPVRRCIAQRLQAQRFECARDSACGTGANFAVPTR